MTVSPFALCILAITILASLGLPIGHAEHFIDCLRAEMRALQPDPKSPPARSLKK